MIEFTEGAAKALAEFVHQIRPAWDRPGILSAIHQAHQPGRDLQLVAHIAVDAACDPTARTPAVIASRDRTVIEARPLTATPADRKPCTRCHEIHVPGVTGCHRRGQIPAEILTETREALAEARAKTAAESSTS